MTVRETARVLVRPTNRDKIHKQLLSMLESVRKIKSLFNISHFIWTKRMKRAKIIANGKSTKVGGRNSIDY